MKFKFFLICLFFCQFVFAKANLTQPPDLIDSLPGLGKLAQTQYAGYVSATEQHCRTLNCDQDPGIFYWFVQTKAKDPTSSKTPIILWSNGGPGSSSLYGLLLENGPYTVGSDLTLHSQKNDWTQFAHYLVFDHPLSVGLSFGTRESYPHNVEAGVNQLYYALQHFLERHPEYQHNPIFLAGESYAGTYLPILAQLIFEHNQKTLTKKINLQGMIVISGWVDPLLQQSMDTTYAYTHGLISYQQKLHIDAIYDKCATAILKKNSTSPAANQICSQVSASIHKISGIYDANIALTHAPVDTSVINYLNQPNVRKALHAKPDGTYALWSDYIDSAYRVGEQDSYRFLYNNLLSAGLPILFITGLNDAKDSNFLGANAWITQLEWPAKKAYHQAMTTRWNDLSTGRVLGYSKKGGGFEWVTVLNAGHLVPIDQPNIKELIKHFVTASTKNR
jgi:vitellogenic carboxypeptidase-like protein